MQGTRLWARQAYCASVGDGFGFCEFGPFFDMVFALPDTFVMPMRTHARTHARTPMPAACCTLRPTLHVALRICNSDTVCTTPIGLLLHSSTADSAELV